VRSFSRDTFWDYEKRIFLETGAFVGADPSVKALLKGNDETGNIKCKITL